MKGATFDHMGNKAGNVKGYSKSTYISGITLKDKKLKLTYSHKKPKDFDPVINEVKSSSGKDAFQLEARGNYFGFVDFEKNCILCYNEGAFKGAAKMKDNVKQVGPL